MDIGVDDKNVREKEMKTWFVKPTWNNQTGGGTVEELVCHSEWLDKLWLLFSAQEKTNGALKSIADIYEFNLTWSGGTLIHVFFWESLMTPTGVMWVFHDAIDVSF